MPKKVTTQDFIDRARAVHGNKYGYAFSVYLSTHTKTSIHCPEHGMFEQSPNNHLNGYGCPSCGFLTSIKSRTKKQSHFINQAIVIHGDKYDYSKVDYVNNKTKIIIICPEHGMFEQSPNCHLSGNGCPGCADTKHTNESFIAKTREVHGDKYDYSLVNYISIMEKVSIRCPEHGVFEQTPNGHLKGYGCPSCAGVKKHTNESFIAKAREIHGDKYDYSLVNYINIMEKVSIHCPEHGMFEQTSNDHLSGAGCPGCAKSGFDRTKAGFLYVLRSDCGRYMKIGITHDPKQRYSYLSKATPFSFERIELVEGQGDLIANLEKELLAEYRPVDFTETFNGYTEWRLWDESIRTKLLTSKIQG